MLLKVVALVIGILSNIVDYMNDSKIFLDYKLLFEALFIGLTLFAFYCNKYISFFGSGLLVIGGIAGMLLTPHAVEAWVWRISSLVSLPFLLYHLLNMDKLTEKLSPEDINQFVFNVIPIVIGFLIFALIEDYLVPEEYSKNKVIDKVLQLVILISFLYFLNYSDNTFFLNLTEPNKLILNVFMLAWLGNIISGIFLLTQLNHLLV